MRSLLIVDNESRIVDSLVFFFGRQKDMDIYVSGAYSAREALIHMERERVDILLTDIRMPGMDGLELQREVVKRWPWCLTIFLTGYNEFEYAQQALRGGGVDYLLKTEGYDAIKNAVIAAVRRADDDEARNKIVESAREQLKLAQPLLRERLILSLVAGREYAADELDAMFSEYGLPFCAARGAFAALARLEGATRGADEDVSVMTVQEMAERRLGEKIAFFQSRLPDGGLLWLMTPSGRAESDAQTGLFIQSALEIIQSGVLNALGAGISICVSTRPVEWGELGESVLRLRERLNTRSIREGGALMLDSREQNDPTVYARALLRESLDRAPRLRECLDSGTQQAFFELFNSIVSMAGESGEEDIRAETFYTVAGILLKYANNWEIHSILGEKAPALKLSSLLDWSEGVEELRELAAEIFRAKSRKIDAREDDFVHRVDWLISENLGNDLSLTMLGEIEGLNPYYLARLYKRITGENLRDRIARARVERARELLRSGEVVNREIAELVGFTSEQAFYRFFKGMTGATPGEYQKNVRERKDS